MHWEFTSLLTQLVSTRQLSSRNPTAIDTNIPESQHSSSLSLNSSQLRDWAEIFQLYLYLLLVCTPNFNKIPNYTQMSPLDLETWVLYLKSFFAGSLNLVVVLLRAERTSFCTFPYKVESASITCACRAGATRRAELIISYERNTLGFASSSTFCCWRLGMGSMRNG